LKWVELPGATIGLVWNSMMSMAGGWFFLMINESFVLGDKDFRLPGIGSYMSVAVARGDYLAMTFAIFAMISMIVLLDQLLWRPVVVWAQKFRLEDSAGGGEKMTSWFLDGLRRSQVLAWLWRVLQRRGRRAPGVVAGPPAGRRRDNPVLSLLTFGVLVAALALGAWQLIRTLVSVSAQGWLDTVTAGLCTLGRVLASTVIGTLWALPAGLAIGLSPRLSRVLQPVVQIAASFPAPMVFPVAIAVLTACGVTLDWGSILLMLLGTQWYILFNVIAGAMAIPTDLREAATTYRLLGWQRFRIVYFPAVFAHLVTGWVTAAGGAWNASIVAEYVNFRGQLLTSWGLGAQISRAAEKADFPSLAAGIVVMSTIVVLFNRVVWRRCYRFAERRYSLSK
ncbi:MAG: ABC transporter permease subunit, partial [Phycisphaeraceae bacterium]|nr:ABC transporter permease subunit [Phycisphaeraceae bacterium]